MEMLDIWRVLLRRWWVLLLPPLLVGALSLPSLLRSGTSAGFVTSFKYTAAQTQSNLPQRDGDYQDVWLASEFVVNAFTEWVRSSSFRQELALAVGENIDLTPLSIAADKARSVGSVQMSYPDGEALARIVAAAVVVLQTRNAAYFPHLGETNAPVTVLDAPVVSPTPAPIVNRLEPIFRVGLAFLVGLLMVALLEAFSPTIRHADELERRGLSVLARIPKG